METDFIYLFIWKAKHMLTILSNILLITKHLYLHIGIIHIKTCAGMFTVALFIIDKIWE